MPLHPSMASKLSGAAQSCVKDRLLQSDLSTNQVPMPLPSKSSPHWQTYHFQVAAHDNAGPTQAYMPQQHD